jgi:hypothetical protein
MVQLWSSFALLLGAVHSVTGSAIAEPNSSYNRVCKSNPYARYAPLAHYAPAKEFCRKAFPSTVTVTKTKTVTPRRYNKRAADPEPEVEPDRYPSSYQSTKCSRRSRSKKCLLSSIRSGSKKTAKTFCGCYFPQKTKTRTKTVTKTRQSPPKYQPARTTNRR